MPILKSGTFESGNLVTAQTGNGNTNVTLTADAYL
jgi:hypothetical protein